MTVENGMETLPRDVVMKSLRMVLKEAYEGPYDPRGTWFVEMAPDSGLFGTLSAVSAEEASRPPAPGRSTIAGHAGHLRFSLEVARRFLGGDRGPFEWEQSWATSSVDEAAWAELRAGLRQEYDAFRRALDEAGELDWLHLSAIVGGVAHAAYHLGAIRQMTLELRGAPAANAETTGARG
ncbi:MAG TPA: DinB family protein [Longimicrobium sp.]|nr:DinB family protein [Longimicrobium sp.]